MMIFAQLYWCVNNDIIMSSERSHRERLQYMPIVDGVLISYAIEKEL